MRKSLTVWITTNCGKFLKEMGIPDHLICLLRNLYAGQEVTVRTRFGAMDWFQIGKGVHQGCILSPCLFKLMHSTPCKWWARWSTSWNQDCRQISITSEMQMTPSLWQKVKRKWRASWWKGKRKVKTLTWNSTFKKLRSWHPVHCCCHYFMANRRGKSGSSDRFYFLGFQNHYGWWLQPWN